MSHHFCGRILVAQNEGLAAREIEAQLVYLGYTVTGKANTGQQVLELVAATQPDLVLMDILLRGDKDGIMVAKELRQAGRPPVVFLSAHAEDGTISRAREAEPFGYIVAPADDRTMRAVIEVALHKHKTERQPQQREGDAGKPGGSGDNPPAAIAEPDRDRSPAEPSVPSAATLAHNLNDILTSILMGSRILCADLKDKDQRQLSQTILNEAQRGADLVKQLLAVGDEATQNQAFVDPTDVLKEFGRLVETDFPKNLRLISRVPPDLWRLFSPASDLRQILLSLCSKARDAMAGGGILTLRAENAQIDETFASMTRGAQAGPHVMFGVRDTGPGLAAESVGRLFDPAPPGEEPGATGGGELAAVMELVQSHGGFIQVESRLGHGTEFKVYLPAGPKESRAEKEPTQEPLPRGHGELILVVDDEACTRDAFVVMLQSYGYKVMSAPEGYEAVAAYARLHHEIKAVICDMCMPGMNGLAVVRALQNIKAQVKVIFSTGQANEENMREAVKLGIPYFLPKPYTAPQLLCALRGLLDQPAA